MGAVRWRSKIFTMTTLSQRVFTNTLLPMSTTITLILIRIGMTLVSLPALTASIGPPNVAVVGQGSSREGETPTGPGACVHNPKHPKLRKNPEQMINHLERRRQSIHFLKPGKPEPPRRRRIWCYKRRSGPVLNLTVVMKAGHSLRVLSQRRLFRYRKRKPPKSYLNRSWMAERRQGRMAVRVSQMGAKTMLRCSYRPRSRSSTQMVSRKGNNKKR